ncbi:MAG: tandem-95 repeat protein, partial [Planctomycetales bacterium]|nr:tandem-95 repeat protein [Planctomycetales bacterium]
WNYTPAANDDTSVSFSYTVTDGTANTAGSATLDITPVNDAPVLQTNLPLTLAEGGTGAIDASRLAVSDVDNVVSDLVFTVTTAPMNGQLELTTNPGVAITSFTQDDIDNNRLVYVHDGSNTTSDSFDFTVSDGSGGSIATNTFNINVTPVDDDAPIVSVNAGSTTTEGAVDTIVISELQFADSEQPATSITYTVTAIPSNGQLELTTAPGIAVATFTQDDVDNGRLVYVHDGSETTADSFAFDVDDGVGNVTSGQLFSIAIAPVNDSPVVTTNTGITLAEGGSAVISSFELDATDPDDSGTGLIYTVTSSPTEGRLELVSNPGVPVTTFTQNDLDTNQLVYVHNGGEGHVDSFAFQVQDGGEDGATADTGVFAITVTPVNDAPVAVNDSFVVGENKVLTGNVKANDSDVDGNPLTVATVPVVSPSSGTLKLNSDGTFTYTPDANFDGVDSFTYKIMDGNGGVDTATVSITVQNLNTAPTANDDTLTASSGIELALDAALLGNDGDPDGDALTIVVVSQPSNGTIEVSATGAFSYIPAAGFLGTDTFTYTVTDGTTASSVATVTVEVTAGIAKPQTTVPNNSSTTNEDNQDVAETAETTTDISQKPVATTQETQLQNHNGRLRPDSQRDDGQPEAAARDTSIGTDTQELIQALLETDPNVESSLRLVTIYQTKNIQTEELNVRETEFGPRWQAVMLDTNAIFGSLDRAIENIQDTEAANHLIVQSAKVFTTGISIGYILWTIRGSYLIAMLSSSLPVWSQFDPVPVLAGWNATPINDEKGTLIDDLV